MATGAGVFATLSGMIAAWFLSPAAKEAAKDAESSRVRPTPEWVHRLPPRKKLHSAIVAVTLLAIVTGLSYHAMLVLVKSPTTITAPP